MKNTINMVTLATTLAGAYGVDAEYNANILCFRAALASYWKKALSAKPDDEFYQKHILDCSLEKEQIKERIAYNLRRLEKAMFYLSRELKRNSGAQLLDRFVTKEVTKTANDKITKRVSLFNLDSIAEEIEDAFESAGIEMSAKKFAVNLDSLKAEIK